MKSNTEKKPFRGFRPMIRSRHPSHSILRVNMPRFNKRSVIRLGSTTEVEDTIDKGGSRIEINKTFAVKNSANKLLMKECFTKDKVKTADWYKYFSTEGGPTFKNMQTNMDTVIDDLPYPIVAKHHFGSRGTGNHLLENRAKLEEWMKGNNLSNFIFERFYNYNREYRLHITEDGCFYTCRKMLKTDTPEEKRWFRNDSNSVWIVEENEQFDKPINWKEIESESVKALKSVGLDIGAVDLRIQSSTDGRGAKRNNPEYIIVEINSAPSFGEITGDKYIQELSKLILKRTKWHII